MPCCRLLLDARVLGQPCELKHDLRPVLAAIDDRLDQTDQLYHVSFDLLLKLFKINVPVGILTRCSYLVARPLEVFLVDCGHKVEKDGKEEGQVQDAEAE